jgi:hypothetical protein
LKHAISPYTRQSVKVIAREPAAQKDCVQVKRKALTDRAPEERCGFGVWLFSKSSGTAAQVVEIEDL